jgi:hypothetical protein
LSVSGWSVESVAAVLQIASGIYFPYNCEDLEPEIEKYN